MHLISCRHEGRTRWGIATADGYYLAPLRPDSPADLLSLIEHHDDVPATAERLLEDAGASLSDDAIALTAPLARPRQNVMCLGLNYAAHAAESMRATGKAPETPQHPVVFTKSSTSVAGPYDPVPLDASITRQLDWEVELAVVVGKHLHKADEARARQAIAGYTIINDLSARDIQFRHKQFFLGKSLERACPMGPVLVTADEIPDPQELDLRCRVNGELKQDGHTGDQVFGVVEILRRLSWIMTLSPGDVIATGTPDGVGFARNPPEFLAPGDVVVCEIERIGSLSNQITAAETTD